jgi:L-seryl-tRNA(Ser) seleniumtransferase
MWEDRVAVIESAAREVEGVTTEVSVPPIANHTPTLTISWDIRKINVSGRDFIIRLQNGNPSIEVRGGRNESIVITVFMLKPGQDKIVAKRVREELIKASVSQS